MRTIGLLITEASELKDLRRICLTDRKFCGHELEVVVTARINEAKILDLALFISEVRTLGIKPRMLVSSETMKARLDLFLGNQGDVSVDPRAQYFGRTRRPKGHTDKKYAS